MANIEVFNKYKWQDGKERVLFLYLILNNYNLDKVEKVIEIVQSKTFGMEFKKIFGVTSEFVDVQRIEAELAEIKPPVVCSLQSYELYSTSETIYSYYSKEESKPLYINDMGVISPLMVISENCIVSSNLAKNVETTSEYGFMYFVDYVLKGYCRLKNWEITYKDRRFDINYITVIEENGKKREHKEMLYQAQELDQTATFKLVLYIIKKVAGEIEELMPDNYKAETWRLEKN